MKKAEDLDPLSLIIGADIAEDLLIAHRYEEAMLQIRRTMDLDSNFALAHYQLGQAFLEKHTYSEAVGDLQKEVIAPGRSDTGLPLSLHIDSPAFLAKEILLTATQASNSGSRYFLRTTGHSLLF